MNRMLATFALIFLMAGCARVPNAFVHMKPDYSELPEAAVRDFAAKSEALVRSGNRDAAVPAAEGLITDTPEIRQALRTRTARFDLLNEFLSTGQAYERRSGLVHIKRNSQYKNSTTRRERDRHALLVMSENENRWTIYEGLVKANKLSPRTRTAIQEIFFKARVPLLEPGQKYETEGGDIAVK